MLRTSSRTNQGDQMLSRKLIRRNVTPEKNVSKEWLQHSGDTVHPSSKEGQFSGV
jgi:hypothetical protein